MLVSMVLSAMQKDDNTKHYKSRPRGCFSHLASLPLLHFSRSLETRLGRPVLLMCDAHYLCT
uniref:Uncharacterized protein n=1 Tax=Anguilla anguilla TaxID=7936 RepID=A0A0E9SPG2_ANGAN